MDGIMYVFLLMDTDKEDEKKHWVNDEKRKIPENQ